MNICHLLIILYLYILSYVYNYFILKYVSIYIYTSILTTLLIIIAIDSYNILDEKYKIMVLYNNTYKLLELQMIENKKLQEIIKKAFKKKN